MRIMHYNIFEGGNQFDGVVSIIKKQAPDVLGLLEANGWEVAGQEKLKRFAEAVEMPHAFLSESVSEFHIASLSKQEMQWKSVQEGFHHALGVCAYDIPDFGTITIVFYHGNPRTEDERVLEVERLIELVAGKEYVVLMGDFNALSPSDPYDPEEIFTQLKAAHIQKFGANILRFDAIRRIKEAGYVDAYDVATQGWESTAPTEANTDPMHNVPVRIDYAFVSPSLVPHIQTCTILKDAETQKSSDHFPIILDLDV